MRAGNLDRQIIIERAGTPTLDDDGVPQFTWDTLATLRAQIISANTEEFIRSYGAQDDTIIIFRTRYIEGVTNADRINYRGNIFNIKEFKEIGRRKGLDIRCKSFGPVTS